MNVIIKDHHVLWHKKLYGSSLNPTNKLDIPFHIIIHIFRKCCLRFQSIYQCYVLYYYYVSP
ncbi:hypothetical protein T08_4115 [Trichinella sp. T8]|nr:hypothetical protein T08_4115 [Trichinella sp. T8]